MRTQDQGIQKFHLNEGGTGRGDQFTDLVGFAGR
jgi:hypothetical protein